MGRLRVPRPGFVGTFALLSAAAVALLGLALAQVEAAHERSTAQSDAAASAQLLVQVGLQPHIERSDMNTGLRDQTVHELDQAFQAGLVDGQLVRIKLWSPSGEVLYSDQHELIGQSFPVEDDLQEALDGELSADVSHVDKAENVDERQFGELLEVYVPVQFGTEHVAFEIYVPWTPIAAQIQANTRRLLLVLVGGLVLLWAVLFRIVVDASRRIRRDRDELERRADENRRLAMFDHLTELPNRLLFFDRVSQTIATSAREGTGVAVLLLDLHHFKDVNDTLGHERGDELLRQVGPRLQGVLRASDTVARLGGDEFGIALAGLGSPVEAEDVARKLTDALDAPFALDGIDIALGGSIGIATYPDHGDDPDQLMRRAEVAMYVAKAARAPFESYSPAQDTYSTDRLALVADLRKAIDDGTLTVAYQPMIDLSRSAIVGVEALLRWTHPTQGAIGPDVFIPLAEHSGLIGRITTYVLEAAAGQAHTWQGAGLDLTVSVNLSVRDLQRAGLAAAVADALERHGVPADRLRLEITEGSVMDQPERALATLGELAAVGVGLSVDDFGTGYSSLAYLQRLPVNELKIDRSFVLGLAESSSDGEIVRSTVGLGHNLGLSIVAEGVEDESSLTFLREVGCDIVQGFFIAKPMSAESLTEWATTSTWRISVDAEASRLTS
ncbi:MAG TPA: EAL domain-containing protein [Actinomycetota bacterium]|nr:EAL domain-containing protein [Actinomycetota bacterium]